MAKTIGKITFENGSFFIKHPDGTLEVAKVGAMLSEGDVIIGSSSNSNSNLIRVSLIDNSSEIQVVGSNEQLFDITLLSGEIPEDTVVPNSQVGDLLEQATNNQQDPNQNNEQATLTLAQIENLDAAAAGADQTTTEPVGIVPLRLEDRTAGETNVVTDLRDAEETLAVIDDTVEADNRIDDVPTTGVNPTISLDDDTLSIDSIGNPLAVDFGQNGAGSVALTDITADASLGLTSSVAGNVMTISQNGVAVMTITLNSAGGTYTYDVNQIAAINHPDATTEDNIDFTVNYVVTDIDGDTATGTFGIVVNDSVPALDIELTETTIPTLTTQDAQTEGVNVSDTASGSFATLFTLTQDMGADVDGTPATLSYALSLATGTTTSLTSAGEAITLSMNNGVVEGKVAGVDEPIFTVAVDASTGTVTLTQNGPIDHLTEVDSDDADTLTNNDSVTNVGLSLTGAINLTASATITDEDGDQRTDSETIDISSAISFDDDVPTITVSGGTTIAEDAVDNVATTDVNESIVTGTWDNANAGADEAASTVVVIGTTEYALGTAIDTGKGTLTVNTNGTWTFDPVTGLDQDTVQSVTFSVKVTDNDGDVASDDHTITITDGTGPSIDPTANSITLTTDEADMATDDTETLTFTLGSDALESIAFGTDLTALVSDTNEVVGTDVVWTRTSDTVITGTIGGQTAITLTLTPNLTAGTASVKADIADNFDSVLGNNGTNTLSLGSVSVVATDIDGDIATGTVNVEVIDDVPTITVSGGTTIAEDAVDNVATTDVNESIVTGTWDNANAGADEAASTVVVIGTTEYALGTAIDTGKGTLTVNTNGTWTFDPVTGLDQDTVQSVTFSVKVTDNDGDVASDDHTITITDGTGPSIDPTANSITLTTDEADMATDDTETLTFTLGSDALESIAFGTDLTALVSDTNEVVGTDVVWTRTSDTVITGTIGGQTAITLTLTPNLTAGTASVKADIADNFDSVLGNNGTNTLSLGSVSVVATDIDGDIATGTVNVEVIDDVPAVNFTDAINNTTTPTVATGTWSETIGADNNSTTLGADVELNWVKVNNVLIPTTTFTFDNSSNTGSGTFVYDGTTYNFDLTLNNNGTYEVVAASLPQTIEINYNEFSSSIKASGPTDTYIVEYQDADTKDIYSAKIYAEVEGNSLSLVNYVNSTTTNIIPSTTVGSTINVSATGIGLGNNVLESYYKNGVYTSESLYFNPDNETNLITLNFTGTGANAFGSGDVIYIELTGVDGTVQTVLLDSVHGDFIVNSDNSLTPISNTYTGGNLSSYSVSLSNGEAIDYVKVTTGFSGTTETNVKLAFSYSVSETVTFNEDLSMNFTATITDADNDQDSIDFDVQFNKVDLIPESTDKVFDMTLGDTKETVNVVITLDLSGSMDDDINDTTRLALAKDAIENMLNAYADNYIVNVKLVTFSDSGTSYDWILNDVDTAIDTVNSLNTGVYTNYEAGVSATYSNYTEPTADKTVAYFISDGAPTSENNEGSDVWFDVGTDSESGWLDTSYKTAWNTFVDTYVDELNVIAVNSGTFSTTYLDALASAEQGNTTIVITDEYQLSNILVNLASEQISGNAYSTISGGNGVISIDAIEVNGTTYNASDYTSSNNTVTLNNWNGTLTFNFSNGAYTYVTSADKFTQDLEKSFKIFASDADGDTTSFDVKINVDIDDTASTPTLDMNISDSTTVISDLTYPDRTISNGATYSQTISLGSAYANKTVTVSFDAQTGGNWNNSDTFKVYNGTISSANEVYSNKNDFTVNNKTFTVTLDSFGNATINFVSYSNESDETIRISDFKVLNSVESYHYTIALDAGLTDNGETLSDITLDNLPAGTTIDGLTANVDGSYTIDINSSGDATVTLISPTQLDPSSLNSITASVTSTETTGDEAVITVTDTSILSVEAGSGDDEIDYTNNTSIDGGEGVDTLILSNSDSIDFSNVNTPNISSIENIDLTASGTQSIAKLTLADVVQLTQDQVDSEGNHILKITGSDTSSTNEDSVNLLNTIDSVTGKGAWTSSGIETIDNVSYNVYTNDTDPTYKVAIANVDDVNISNS